MSIPALLQQLIEEFCLRDDLSTYDPYDIWKTPVGFGTKQLYNASPRIGVVPAGVLAVFDNFVNNRARLFYSRMEYPIVRALAALSLLNLYESTHEDRYRDYARRHINWLIEHPCKGYSGLCWGLGFPNAVSKKIVYDSNTPYTPMTPYALEAFLRYSELTGDSSLAGTIGSVRRFFDNDVAVMEEDSVAMATSYGPFRDRIVINAVSYAMYSYALLLPYANSADNPMIQSKIQKLYAYIRRHQRTDGSWLYSPQESSFIDCFHSCFVLKNLIKTNRLFRLESVDNVISDGYLYIKNALFDRTRGLCRRFSVANKPGLIRFDLYDNAEALSVALLLRDRPFADDLLRAILRQFVVGRDIYSQIDMFGQRRGKNTLRWAAMPFIHAYSLLALGS